MSATAAPGQAAETQAVQVQSAAPDLPEYSLAGYFTGLSVLFVLLGLLWFGLRYLRRKGVLSLPGQQGGLALESRLGLGPKKNLLVLRYRDKRLLLGVTDHHITLLDSEPCAEEQAPEGAPAPARNFRELLHGLTHKQ